MQSSSRVNPDELLEQLARAYPELLELVASFLPAPMNYLAGFFAGPRGHRARFVIFAENYFISRVSKAYRGSQLGQYMEALNIMYCELPPRHILVIRSATDTRLKHIRETLGRGPLEITNSMVLAEKKYHEQVLSETTQIVGYALGEHVLRVLARGARPG